MYYMKQTFSFISINNKVCYETIEIIHIIRIDILININNNNKLKINFFY